MVRLLKSTDHHKALLQSLEIKSRQWSSTFEHRPLSSSEKGELDAIKQKLAEPVLDEGQFKLFSDLVKQYGGKIVPLLQPEPEKEKPKPPKKITDVVLTKELVYEYSGRAYLTFPEGSKGNIIHEWEDVPWISKEKIDDAKLMCKNGDYVPLYCEWQLICVRRKDFKIEGERACA